MTPPARYAAAIEVLDAVLAGLPAEKALTSWGRAHRFAGSGDRAALRDLVFDALRCRRSLAALGGAETGRGLMIGALRRDRIDMATVFTGAGHAPAPVLPGEQALPGKPPDPVRLDLPDWLFEPFSQAFGPLTEHVLAVMQARAPVFLRVNLRRATPDQAVQSLAAEGIVAVAHPQVRTALQVIDNERKIQLSQAYLTGLVEVQDAASQAAVLRLPLRTGARVLDYCAGGGGKALAMAALSDATIFAHDADPRRMVDLAPRATRAGVQIDRVATADLPRMAGFDLIVLDAPCSGSGTWRRNPQAKWRLTPAELDRLCALQARILTEAVPLLAPGGRLAYATCSVFGVENAAQIDRFLQQNPAFRLCDDWQHRPDAAGDGFYLAQLSVA